MYPKQSLFPRGDNQDGGGRFLGEITKMAEVFPRGDNQEKVEVASSGS